MKKIFFLVFLFYFDDIFHIIATFYQQKNILVQVDAMSPWRYIFFKIDWILPKSRTEKMCSASARHPTIWHVWFNTEEYSAIPIAVSSGLDFRTRFEISLFRCIGDSILPVTESTTHVISIDDLTTIHMELWKKILSVVSLSVFGAVCSMTCWLVPLF